MVEKASVTAFRERLIERMESIAAVRTAMATRRDSIAMNTRNPGPGLLESCSVSADDCWSSVTGAGITACDPAAAALLGF